MLDEAKSVSTFALVHCPLPPTPSASVALLATDTLDGTLSRLGRLAVVEAISVPASINVLPVYPLLPSSSSVPLPILVKLPEPWSVPAYVELAPLFPTVRDKAAEVALLRLNVPVPVRPPSVKEVIDPIARTPLPLVSSVLFSKASGLPTTESVPDEMKVSPEYVFVPISKRVPLPDLTMPPGPASVPRSVRVFPPVSNVAIPPLAAKETGASMYNEFPARKVPPVKAKIGVEFGE